MLIQIFRETKEGRVEENDVGKGKKDSKARSFQGGEWEKMGLSRRLHSSLHFSAASENNASPTQSAKHYSLLLRPFSTTVLVVDSRSQFCNDPSRRAALHLFLPFPLLNHCNIPHTCIERYDFVSIRILSQIFR